MNQGVRTWSLSVAAAGALFAIGYGLAGPFVADLAHAESFADLIESGRLRALVLNVVSLTILPLAFHALRRSGENRATRWASVLGTIGPVWTVPGAGYLALVLPEMGKSSVGQAFALNETLMGSALFSVSLALSGLAVTVAFIIGAIELVRRGAIGMLVAVVLVISAAFLSFAPAVPVTELVFPIDLTGAVLMAVGGIWIFLRSTEGRLMATHQAG